VYTGMSHRRHRKKVSEVVFVRGSVVDAMAGTVCNHSKGECDLCSRSDGYDDA
jgi:hypothetical protein